MKTESGIVLENVVKSFGETHTVVLKRISLKITAGNFVSLTGRSGSGKSTLLYMMSGLDRPTEGSIHIDGRDINALDTTSVHQFRNREMGFVFQFHYLLPELTAIENVLMPARKDKQMESRRAFAEELMKQFEILGCRDKKPSQMSGGEQQRVAIARALIMEPRYLFADEPTGNLDSVNGRSVIEIIKRVNRELNTTIIMVTHERDYAAEAHREIVLVDGEIAEDRVMKK